MLQFGQDRVRRSTFTGSAGFRQNAPSRFIKGVPVLRARLRRRLESPEVVNISSRLIFYELIFCSGLPDTIQKNLYLAAIVHEVTQPPDMVQQGQLVQLSG